MLKYNYTVYTDDCASPRVRTPRKGSRPGTLTLFFLLPRINIIVYSMALCEINGANVLKHRINACMM